MTSLKPGDRVRMLGGGDVGTVRRVEGDDVRVRWDQPVASGVTATWTAAHRLEVLPRVRLISTGDPHTRLQPGAIGTVLHTDDAGTVHVRWEGGSTLGLIPGADEWERVTLCTRCGRELAPGCCPTVADPAWRAENGMEDER